MTCALINDALSDIKTPQKPLSVLEVETIDLHVTPQAIGKADFAFSTKVFERLSSDGEVRLKGKNTNPFHNRPRFKYAEGYMRVNGGVPRKISWRYRGLLDAHWRRAFPLRSMKINFEPDPALGFDVLNINHIETDLFLRDMIGHEIYHAYGLITPRMKLVRFYVNGKYEGFRVLVENIDDHFLSTRGLPPGNVYSEDTAAVVGDKILSGPKYYQLWWMKKSLERQNNWDDWIHFNHVLARFKHGTSSHLFDLPYFVRWRAIGLLLPVRHMIDHNLFMYHNLENQKWYQLPWDMTVSVFEPLPEDVLLYAPNKMYASFIRNVSNYYARNREAWRYLNDDQFFERVALIVRNVFNDYEAEFDYCRKSSTVCDGPAYQNIDWPQIHHFRDNAQKLLDEKRQKLKAVFGRLPEFITRVDQDKLIINGSSSVEFKLLKNNWELVSIKNLTVLQETDDEAVFLIQIDPDAAHTYRGKRHVQPMAFEIVLKRGRMNSGDPQFASLYGQNVISAGQSNFPEPVSETRGLVDDGSPVATEVSEIKSLNHQSIAGFLIKQVSAVANSDLYRRLNSVPHVEDYLERVLLKFNELKKRETLAVGRDIHWSGEKVLTTTTIVPHSSTLVLEPGTVLKLDRKVSLIVRGSLKSMGTKTNPVLITSLKEGQDPRNAWGSVCFIYSISEDSMMRHTVVEYGSETREMGIHCKGAVSAYHVPFSLFNAEFRHNRADDAINFLYSKALVEDSYFHDNKSDAIDADFSNISVKRTRFINNGNDGLDFGTALAEAAENIFVNQGDKGISVGEESRVNIHDNIFTRNQRGIAVKDASLARIQNNVFMLNRWAVDAYIKKSKYAPPRIEARDNYVWRNTFDYSQDTMTGDSNLRGFEPIAEEGNILKILSSEWLKQRIVNDVLSVSQ